MLKWIPGGMPPVLLSLLVFPGLGQAYNRRWVKAAAFGVAFGICGVYCFGAMLGTLGTMMDGLTSAADPQALSAQMMQSMGRSLPAMFGTLVVYIWAAIDAWRDSPAPAGGYRLALHRVLLFPGTPYEIYTYGAMLSVAILLAGMLFYPRAMRIGMSDDVTTRFLGIFIVATIAGGRIMHVMLEWPYYAQHPAMILNLREGGLALYGAILGGTITLFACARAYRIALTDLLDAAAPSCILAQGIGRIGCFFNGCCYGKFCPPPWGVYFKDAERAVAAIPRYPTQLYELAADLAICGLLLWFTQRRHYRGEVFAMYLTLYALVRFVIEYWRDEPIVAMGLTFAQWCGVVALIGGLIGWLLVRARSTVTEGLGPLPAASPEPASV